MKLTIGLIAGLMLGLAVSIVGQVSDLTFRDRDHNLIMTYIDGKYYGRTGRQLTDVEIGAASRHYIESNLLLPMKLSLGKPVSISDPIEVQKVEAHLDDDELRRIAEACRKVK